MFNIKEILYSPRKKRDFYPIQHWMMGFSNWDEKCLLRGTDWVFKQNRFSNWDEECLLRGTDWVFKQNSLCTVLKELT